MDFNGLNKWKPLVKSKIKTEATRLFLVEDKENLNSFKCPRTMCYQMCRRTRWNSFIHSSQECLLRKIQAGNCSLLQSKWNKGQHFGVLPAALWTALLQRDHLNAASPSRPATLESYFFSVITVEPNGGQEPITTSIKAPAVLSEEPGGAYALKLNGVTVKF